MSFLLAVADRSAPRHTEITNAYRSLLDDFEDHRRRLVALDDHLAVVDPELRQELFAPVRTLHVAAQHRRAAASVVARTGIEPAVALVLVMLRRERIGALATIDHRLTSFAVELIPPAPLADTEPADEAGGPGNAQLSN